MNTQNEIVIGHIDIIANAIDGALVDLADILDEVQQHGRTAVPQWCEARDQVGPPERDAEIIQCLLAYTADQNGLTLRQLLPAVWATRAYAYAEEITNLPARFLFGTFLVEYARQLVTGGQQFTEMSLVLRAMASQV